MKLQARSSSFSSRSHIFLKAAMVLTGVFTLLGCTAKHDKLNDLIILESQGALAVGGDIIGSAANLTQHCGHGVAEYQIPANRRSMSLLMWHSASTAAWQNRWDGGEGFQTLLLKQGYPVYLWDGPEVGRADWSCRSYSYTPQPGLDQQNFAAWRLGPAYMEFFEGVQFPVDNPEAWHQATRGRYQEFDTLDNIELQARAGARLADQIGPTVALTNSAGGMRALLAATLSSNIRSIVAYENVGFVFPQGQGPDTPQGPFGPIEVPLEEFMKLTEIPLQFIWGDNLTTGRFDSALEQNRLFVDLINRYGGDAQMLMLPDAGLHGNTHLPFADMNNTEVAELLTSFLNEKQLSMFSTDAE